MNSPTTRAQARAGNLAPHVYRVAIVAAVGLALSLPALAAADASPVAKLSAQQIVDKNIAARGGLPAWHAVQTMAWTGKLDAGPGDSAIRSARYAGAGMVAKNKSAITAASLADAKPAEPEKQVQLPFVLEMKRPGMSRMELEFNGKTAVQVYDGKSGWKLRPFLNRDDWEPFTPEELKTSAGKWDLDGPLLDAAAKGTKVDLEGVEAVDGQAAYRLKLSLKSGDTQHVWVDAKTFLDVRVEGTPRRMDGKMRPVYITQSDFRQVQGLMVPYTLATKVEGYAEVHKMVIDKVSLNAVLADTLFTKPKSQGGI